MRGAGLDERHGAVGLHAVAAIPQPVLDIVAPLRESCQDFVALR